jgi:hypothetical protein
MKKNTTVAPNAAMTAWSGRIDDYERTRAGGLLMGALLACASERGETLGEMCTNLGYGYGYLSQLRGGLRNVHSISDDFAAACAAYLGTSRIHVLMMAGRVTPADFFASGDAYRDEVTRALDFICVDPQWGRLITNELRSSGLDSQYAVVRLYEAATGTVLIRTGLDAPQDMGNDAAASLSH